MHAYSRSGHNMVLEMYTDMTEKNDIQDINCYYKHLLAHTGDIHSTQRNQSSPENDDSTLSRHSGLIKVAKQKIQSAKKKGEKNRINWCKRFQLAVHSLHIV